VKLRSQTNGKAHRHDAERAVQWERAALGVLLETPEMWTQIDNLSGEDFLLSDHRIFFQTISDLHHRNSDAEIVAVIAELGDTVTADFVTALIDGCVRPNFAALVEVSD
jgi:replicative DNA helicase